MVSDSAMPKPSITTLLLICLFSSETGGLVFTTASSVAASVGAVVAGFVGDEAFQLVRKDVDRNLYPWNLENAPLSIHVKAKELLDWEESRGSASQICFSTQWSNDTGEEAMIELIPYGCTTLRIALFPERW